MGEDINTVLELKNNDKSEKIGIRNRIAAVINVFGYLEIVIGIIVGFYLANKDVVMVEYFFEDFKWGLAFAWWAASFLSGILILGFSEIIELLDRININTKNIAAKYMDS